MSVFMKPKETLSPIRECFPNSPVKECSCKEAASQRDLHKGNFPKRLASPIRECFYSTQRDLHIANFPKRPEVPSKNVF